MTTSMQIEQRRRAMLIQALEERWPGCRAHSKRDQATGRNDIVVSDLLAPPVLGEIRAFLAGWEAGGSALLACLQAPAPFPDVDTAALTRGRRQGSVPRWPQGREGKPAAQGVGRRDDRAAQARAGLDALFSADTTGES